MQVAVAFQSPYWMHMSGGGNSPPSWHRASARDDVCTCGQLLWGKGIQDFAVLMLV